MLGVVALGYYLLAFNISNWVPGIVGTAVRYVSVPSFSRLAERDAETLALGVRRSVPVVAAVILPAAIVMATLAPQLVDFLYGDKWGPSAAALRYLAVLMVVRMLTSLAFDILTGLGATRYTVWLNAGWAVALVPALWIGAHMDGIRGAAIAHGVVAVFVALPLAVLALRVAGVSLAPTLPALVRPTIGAAIAAAIAAGASQAGNSASASPGRRRFACVTPCWPTKRPGRPSRKTLRPFSPFDGGLPGTMAKSSGI